MIYGIIGAMPEEIEKIKPLINNIKITNFGNKEYYSGDINEKQVVLTCSGIGKVSATIATTILITNFKVDVVINTGVAGGLGKEVKVLDLVIANNVSQHDFDLTVFGRKIGEVPGFNQLVDLTSTFTKNAEQLTINIASKLNFKVHSGTIVSGDQFISNKEIKQNIELIFPTGKAVDMESAAIGQVCANFEIPCLILRTISDNANDEANITFEELLPIAVDHGKAIILEILK
ncbi:MAG: 5'-methylthioadenosine/adenosylhomocysteine nucleosidase [Succinivibrionaceae bacterium]